MEVQVQAPAPTRDRRHLVGVGIVLALFLVIGYQYLRVLGPVARESRMSACRALEPTPFNQELFQLPRRAPAFAAADATGRLAPLSAYLGRVVLLNFWHPTCQPCADEMPALEELQARLGPEGLDVLALVSDSSFDPARRFFTAGTNLTVLLDPAPAGGGAGAIARRYGTVRWPESYLIDRRGVVRYYFVSTRDWASPAAQACVRALLEED